MDAPPIQYARTADGVNIAYAVTGQGPTVLILPFVFSHLHHWFKQPASLALLEVLGHGRRLAIFDWRGTGLSQRDVDDHSVDAWVRDIEAVVEALGLPTVAMVGLGEPAIFGLRFAARHPARVERMVLYSTPLETTATTVGALSSALAGMDWDDYVRTLVRVWKNDEVALDSERFIRDAIEQDALVAKSRTLETMTEGLEPVLARLELPVLMIQPAGHGASMEKQVRELTARIPNAQLAMIPGSSSFPAGEGLFRLGQAVDQFLGGPKDVALELGAASGTPFDDGPPANLTPRELEVLRLIALGRTNAEIADALVIRPSTVSRHVHHVLQKTKAHNRAEAVTWAFVHRILQD